MKLDAFCRQSNVVVVVGKGGVGKTTVAATLATASARAGLDVLLVALDSSGPLPGLFGIDHALDYEMTELRTGEERELGDNGAVPGRIRGQMITSDLALLEYLAHHGLGRVSKRLIQSGAIEVVSTAIPGIREVLVLGKLKQLELANIADLIILDAPASGHAVSLFTSSGGLLDAARGGPLRSQAEQVVELLSDSSRCQAILVTSPEETPVNETIETAYRLEDEVGIALGPVVVNSCYPHLTLDVEPEEAARRAGISNLSSADSARLSRAATFRSAREDLQQIELERLGRELPLDRITLPYLFEPEFGAPEIELLADALITGVGQLRE
jgi:anion-transporting  ArsA/GET3 family ATPase